MSLNGIGLVNLLKLKKGIRKYYEKIIFFAGRFPVKVRKGLACGARWSIYPYSAYWRLGGGEPHIDALFQRYAAVNRSLVFWDIGAHHGIYSVGIARHCGTEVRVEAFEPDPVSRGRLRWHRFLNCLPQIHIHPVAVSDKTAEACIYQYGRLGDSSSHLPFPDETLDKVPNVRIKTVRLDDWLKQGRIAAPDLVKIDVEGHAVAALQGMREALAGHLPIIVLAVHDIRERDQGGDFLRKLGYTLSPVSPAAARAIEARAFGELLCLPPGG